ncbi:MAG: carbamoyltransferase HypF, partial [bacterium]|nr:carbamoyltransferase HypF [bacterium]
LGLAGWVRNSASGLTVEVEGAEQVTEEFLGRLDTDRPAPAVVLTTEISRLAPAGFREFEIRASDDSDEKTAAVLPDLATCAACLAELRDPANRRFEYPFTNCTHCGPRYTIVNDIPYDRPNTTMQVFTLCDHCRREYTAPADRRFHAQPNACSDCGPRLTLSITEAAQALREGRILALKGIGGFQLLVDATSAEAVERLRRRKLREEKPFALLMPDLATVRRFCVTSPDEERLLGSPAAPIVLLRPKPVEQVAANVARSSPFLGVMLPCSPL